MAEKQSPVDIDALSGSEFLNLSSEQQQRCAEVTSGALPKFGRNAPKCHEQLGRALNVLDGAASCRWGCSKGDHLVEYLLGKGASNAHAAFLLLYRGFYDESLGLARSIGELANLLLLFGREPADFAKWRESTRAERVASYSPVRIRQRLEGLSFPLGIERDRYSALCEIGVHATPATKPNFLSPDNNPRLGGHFQLPGAIVAMNELAYAVGLAMAGGSKLVSNKAVGTKLSSRAVKLIASIGAMTILNLDEAMAKMRTAIDDESHGVAAI
jgi:hypothetical protein